MGGCTLGIAGDSCCLIEGGDGCGGGEGEGAVLTAVFGNGGV